METLFNLVPFIVFLPVIGLLINMIFGGRMGEKAIGAVASAASGLAFVVSVLLGVALWQTGGEAHVVPFAEWIKIGTLDVPWNFRVDTLSVTMMLVVSGVGTLIHIYAIGYMHEDVRFKKDEKRYRRFFVFLNLFIAMMMILVSGDSYLIWIRLAAHPGQMQMLPRRLSLPTASAILASCWLAWPCSGTSAASSSAKCSGLRSKLRLHSRV
jgi:formate hydrogenlyase subunit 3/multisubunit Na+/H+ antiporter MnhD subunit